MKLIYLLKKIFYLFFTALLLMLYSQSFAVLFLIQQASESLEPLQVTIQPHSEESIKLILNQPEKKYYCSVDHVFIVSFAKAINIGSALTVEISDNHKHLNFITPSKAELRIQQFTIALKNENDAPRTALLRCHMESEIDIQNPTSIKSTSPKPQLDKVVDVLKRSLKYNKFSKGECVALLRQIQTLLGLHLSDDINKALESAQLLLDNHFLYLDINEKAEARAKLETPKQGKLRRLSGSFVRLVDNEAEKTWVGCIERFNKLQISIVTSSTLESSKQLRTELSAILNDIPSSKIDPKYATSMCKLAEQIGKHNKTLSGHEENSQIGCCALINKELELLQQIAEDSSTSEPKEKKPKVKPEQ